MMPFPVDSRSFVASGSESCRAGHFPKGGIRHVPRVDEDCRLAVVDILDILVRAGWPAARELAFRMDSIFE